ncbi:MAG: hypothetical protein EZS28_028843, partial [Streblomastix strix]
MVEQSEKDIKYQQIINERIDQIIADKTKDNVDSDQTEISIVHLTNENDGLGKNVYGTQFMAAVTREANSQINLTKISEYAQYHNIFRSDGLGGNGFGTQLKATTTDNE